MARPFQAQTDGHTGGGWAGGVRPCRQYRVYGSVLSKKGKPERSLVNHPLSRIGPREVLELTESESRPCSDQKPPGSLP